MAESLRGIIVAIVLVGLFVLSLVGFFVQFAADNNTNISLMDEGRISSVYGNVNASIVTFSTTSNTSYTTITQETPKQEEQEPILSGWNAIITLPSAAINIAKNFAQISDEYLGVNPIILTTLIAILFGTIALLAWKAWRAGE